MIRSQSVVIAVATLWIMVAVGIACNSSDRGGGAGVTVPPQLDSTAPGDKDAGGGPRVYDPPVRLTEGEYISPASLPGEYERGLAALAEDDEKPRFQGVVNGVRLYSFDGEIKDPSVAKNRCGSGGFREDLRPDEELVFGYLPPGTFAETPQLARLCDDGSTALVEQHFQTRTATFQVWFDAGELAMAHDATEDRVSAGTVSGRPAVLIRPNTPEGFLRTYVAVVMDRGLLIVDARYMPLDEAIRIAEGVKCGSC